MKRKTIILSFLICLVNFLVMGCKTDFNSSNTNVSGSLSVESTTDGIQITLPHVPGTKAIYITRYNQQNNYDQYKISTYDMTKNVIMDYFVEKDKSYNYTLSYKDNNWKEIYKITSKEIKALGGKGELQFSQAPEAKYDPTTAKLTFLKLPKLPPEMETFVGTNNIKYYFQYRYFPNGGYYGKVGSGINYTVDSNGKISNYVWINEGYENTAEGKSMVLIDLSGIEVRKDSVTYTKYMSHTDLPSMPNNISFHDPRPPVTLETTNDGIKIILPQVEGTKHVQITRYNAKNESDKCGISLNDITKAEVMDYFVQKDKSYYYQVIYKDESWNEIYNKTSKIIQAKGGKGELQFSQAPEAKYDSTTAKLTFLKLPKLPPEMETFVGTNNIKYYFQYRYFPNGGYYGTVGSGINYTVDSNGKISNRVWINEGYENTAEGKSMVLIDLSGIEVRKDSVTYTKYMSHTDLPSMPNNIPFHDPRQSITLEATNDGIKINIPKIDNSDIAIYSIDRFSNSYTNDAYICINDINTTEFTDYYVESGKEYTYQIRYRDSHGYDIVTSKQNKIKATGGLGKVEFSKRPEATYNNGVMTFTQQPKIQNCPQGYKVSHYQFCYRHFPNGGYTGNVGGGIDYTLLPDGTVQSNDFVNPGYNVEGKDMVLINFSGVTFVNENNNKISYTACLGHEGLPGMPNPIKFHKIN